MAEGRRCRAPSAQGRTQPREGNTAEAKVGVRLGFKGDLRDACFKSRRARLRECWPFLGGGILLPAAGRGPKRVSSAVNHPSSISSGALCTRLPARFCPQGAQDKTASRGPAVGDDSDGPGAGKILRVPDSDWGDEQGDTSYRTEP